MDIEVLMKKGKSAAAAYIHSECCRSGVPETLKSLLDVLLDPLKGIDEFDTIEWCKRLMAGVHTLEEFSSTVRKYDNATTCGLVWTANFVAYRCRTCGISPCMSLCAECFKRGDHRGHDFNMFRSQAGGACDCGDTNVMKESGFCFLHGPQGQPGMNEGPAPPDLLAVANAMMPRLILRLLLYMRENSKSLSGFLGSIEAADKFITMLHEMSSMGAAMRSIMTQTLTNPHIYKNLTDVCNSSPEYFGFMARSKRSYEEALISLPNPEPPDEYKDIPSLQKNLIHRTFLEELVFWTVKFEFPQKVVCLLLNLLPDSDYKEAFTRAFVLHYSRISQLLVHCQNPDMLSNRVVHVSVQLFSNEKLALRMAEEMGLLHVMVISLKYMMSKITVPSTLHNKENNKHRVVDCGHLVMKDHCYWPLVSDLNNILSHRPVALKFLGDDGLMKMWFSFLALFQGMNVNHRELNQHIEFEPSTYYAAFSAELEASASPMWALVSHLKDSSTAHLTRNLLRHCRVELMQWLNSVNHDMINNDALQVSFHLPLHRYYSVFIHQAVRVQQMHLAELLPHPSELLAIVQHPLRVQTAFYEIVSGLWVRNGLQIKGQALTYIQCHFCNSMVDADLFLLQIAMMNLDYGDFIMSVLEKFHIVESLSVSTTITNSYLEPDQEILMMENCIIFLAALVSVRTSLGISDGDLVTLEMITLLCIADKTHSQLMELMPERCGNNSQSRDFEAVLEKVADYRAPNFESSGNMLQGMYVPKPYIWETIYDPIYVLLRGAHRRDFQTSLDRFTDYARMSGKFKGSTPWPPFREPEKTAPQYTDPRNVLSTRVLHGIAFVIFYKAVHTTQISDQVVALAIFLLEMALSITEATGSQVAKHEINYGRYDMNFSTWFDTDSLFANLKTEIDSVLVQPYSSTASDSDADVSEMEVESFDLDYDNYETNAVATIMPPDYMRPGVLLGDGRPLALMAPNTEDETQTIEERQRHRTLQLVLAPLKPVISLQRMDIERSSSVAGNTSIEVILNESIISLLLKLHSKFSAAPNSYIPFWETPEAEEIISNDPAFSQSIHFPYTILYDIINKNLERIGDGPYFIKKLLDQISSKDEGCRESIKNIRNQLWPEKLENECKLKNDDDKRKKAQESRERKMAEIARNRDEWKKFVSKNKDYDIDDLINNSSSSSGNKIYDDEYPEQMIKPIEYDCVICNQTSASTNENPFGLVILLQSTSILGHRKKMDSGINILPTNDEELLNNDTMKIHSNNRLEEYKKQFDEISWHNICLSIGWDGGVHVQTCGHHLHNECLKGYLSSLKSQQRQHNISIDRGEYSCPLCRQLANSFLPLSSEFGTLIQTQSSSTSTTLDLTNKLFQPSTTKLELGVQVLQKITPISNPCLLAAKEIMRLQIGYLNPTKNTIMMDATENIFLEDMINHMGGEQLILVGVGPDVIKRQLYMLISIIKTNIELELVSRGGNLLSLPIDPQPSTSSSSSSPSTNTINKRSCIMPLLHILGTHYKTITRGSDSPPTIWAKFMGTTTNVILSMNNRTDIEVPLLLCDPCTMLIHLILNLPMRIDLALFSCIIQTLFNLVYIQILTQTSCRLRESQRNEAKSSGQPIEPLIKFLENSLLYIRDTEFNEHIRPSTREEEKQLLLPYLRIASLLKHYIYELNLPIINTSENEFILLGKYLNIDYGVLTNPTNWISCDPIHTIKIWCDELSNFTNKNPITCRKLISTQYITWNQPKLLQLPTSYDIIFQYYHRKLCNNCKTCPNDPSICLVCGTLVCMREQCCKRYVFEATEHTLECGGGREGTALFLSINSSTIVVVRGKRACLWGSVYLDCFGEEDRELKRGKPLYLSKERYGLLEQQWLNHRFDHTTRKWIFHRDTL